MHVLSTRRSYAFEIAAYSIHFIKKNRQYMFSLQLWCMVKRGGSIFVFNMQFD